MSKLHPLPSPTAPLVTPETAPVVLEELRSLSEQRRLRERRLWLEVLRRAEAGDLRGVVEIARQRVGA